MRAYINELSTYVDRMNSKKKPLFLSLILSCVSFLSSSLHYASLWYGNNLSWISWLSSVALFSYAFLPSKKRVFHTITKKSVLFVAGIIAFYILAHLWNFQHAPWNQNGLFDDAAWDIYFSKNHAFNGPYQAAFFDEVGYISRETVFAYYISVFFKIFGYNLLVFNISLLVLGGVTVLFTTLLIHEYFKNNRITLLSFFVLNFFPFHYMHIFMGHRYAIATPLMMISLYFLYTAFLRNSYIRAILSSFFAALCMGSAVMGKQYIGGLLLTAILIFLFGKKEWKSKNNYMLVTVWIIGFIISGIPLIAYIFWNYDVYAMREQGLLKDFFAFYKEGGVSAIRPYIDGMEELFFAGHSYRRQFLTNFPLIPFAYYILLLPGLAISFLKKRYEIVLLSLIPVLGAFFSGAYDFRVLLSVPIWIIAMAFLLEFIHMKFSGKIRNMCLIGYSLVVAIGLISSITYILAISADPHSQYLLPHKDVAVSRLLQDIVIGEPNPSFAMKPDELNRVINLSKISYDVLACPNSAYAIAHVYLQNYDDKKVLSLCDGGIQLLKTPEEIIKNAKSAILSYEPDGKDVKLIWEVSDKSAPAIALFEKYNTYGSDTEISNSLEGERFSFYILTIKKENVSLFKEAVSQEVVL